MLRSMHDDRRSSPQTLHRRVSHWRRITHRLIVVGAPMASLEQQYDVDAESLEQHGSMMGASAFDPARLQCQEVLPPTAPGAWPQATRPWKAKPMRKHVHPIHAPLSRTDLSVLALAERVESMETSIRYMRNLYDAMHVRVHAAEQATKRGTVPQRPPGEALTFRMKAASSDHSGPETSSYYRERHVHRESPTMEVTLGNDTEFTEADLKEWLASLVKEL